jgi:hypothetical protein
MGSGRAQKQAYLARYPFLRRDSARIAIAADEASIEEGKNAMMKLGKCSTLAVLGLVFSLTLLSTGAFAQSARQQVEHSRQISVSAHAATAQNILRDTASMILNSSLQGTKSATNSCGHGGCAHTHLNTRCAAERECHTVQVCHWAHGGRICRGEHICRFRSLCRRCFDHNWNTPWNGKRH